MRSTVRIDDDLMAALKAEANRRGISLTRAFNRILRIGLKASGEPGHPEPPRHFSQTTASLGPAPIDLDKALALSSALEDEETLREFALRK
jgi:hypothetical protein